MTLLLVVVVLLVRAPRGDSLQKVDTTVALPPAVNQTFASIAPSKALELPIEKAAKKVVAVDNTKSRQTDGRAARLRKGKSTYEANNVRERKILKPAAARIEVAGASVSSPAPAYRRETSPLSTQLVSSPSKTAVKPKVIQWP